MRNGKASASRLSFADHKAEVGEKYGRVPNNFKLLEFYSCASFFKLLFQFL